MRGRPSRLLAPRNSTRHLVLIDTFGGPLNCVRHVPCHRERGGYDSGGTRIFSALAISRLSHSTVLPSAAQK